MIVLDTRIEEAGYDKGDPTIRNISFQVHAGELVGLIGPNGAGKSTTIKSILGIMREVKGAIRIGDGTGTYAYVPEQPVLYDSMTLWEHLELAAAAHELPEAEFRERAEELLGIFQLTEVKHHLPTSFSKGMQQKLMLIIAFLLKPSLYIVDEPFVGLDPRATRRFLRMLEEERKRGAGVLMSTHVLDTAERVCDSFVLIHQGRIVASGTLDQVRGTSGLPEGTLFDCFEVLT
ncbi:ABC transporter ATP-binding protein [Paenibacillus dendritiformis]|uniref:ABC transporter ATP-binding protein n=1 Tax=Paenibacillus dendritiformis TaxID=130049 RepID=UPI000DA80250|nr:ABC transporter ATP-binding protein [Paenibacillus dendritiformis]PZM66482.1 ABC transporter ATP-binding protein [Paenibacillus dendritiformis]TDL52892.1 ABC transporter ATP-binding protein [Paenibacillus dendritiformis]WGU92842.1 ABC transporter ATP-binding protein [Paenibacillus dendritiformis]